VNSCPKCGEGFDDNRAMAIHHKLSHGESLKTKETTCDECSKLFTYYPSDKEGIYCSSCVEDVPWEWIDDSTGEEHPAWNRVDVSCSQCGKDMERKSSSTNNSGIYFCSDECMGDYRSENWVQEDHPNWKGGNTGSYGRGWTKIRRQARERDGYQCKNCGKKGDDCYGPEVHHIKPVREFDEIEEAHSMGNVISLCRVCHVNADHGNIDREKLKRKI
jgi:5-methylcytosine-specific restriction endonuclease McrA